MESVTLFGVASGDIWYHHVLHSAAHGLAADTEPLAGKLPHGPVDKGHHHEGGLAGPYGSITYDYIKFTVWKC